jgi:CBS domain-containing protein
VTGEHGVIGLITEQDLKSALGRGANRGAEQPGLSVNDVYRSKPYVVDLHEPLEHVLATMAERHIDAAIVTRAGRLAGVFTWVDACRSFAAFLRERFPHPADDGNDAA